MHQLNRQTGETLHSDIKKRLQVVKKSKEVCQGEEVDRASILWIGLLEAITGLNISHLQASLMVHQVES